MKKTLLPFAVALSTMLLAGCVGLSFGGGSKSETKKSTVGQQLVDLQKAKDVGAISEAEFQVQKAKVLHGN